MLVAGTRPRVLEYGGYGKRSGGCDPALLPFLWYYARRSDVDCSPAQQKLLRHTSLWVTHSYVDPVARDLRDTHRRASPEDSLRVRRRA